MAHLARVTDPDALATCERGRARLTVEVEAAWFDEGMDLSITAPARLVCARCEGGGCDGCARSGVLRAPEEATARVVLAHVSAQRTGRRGASVALRIPDPFGADHAVGQLYLELHAAERASDGVHRRPPAPAPALAAAGPRIRIPPLAVAVLLTCAGLLAALLAR